jgi:hypothetical protein
MDLIHFLNLCFYDVLPLLKLPGPPEDFIRGFHRKSRCSRKVFYTITPLERKFDF